MNSLEEADWRKRVELWAASPLDFALEALFGITRASWRPWMPGTPRPQVAPAGLEKWQGDLLDDVARAKLEGKRRFTIRSGHGTGKSATQAILIIWLLLFHRDLKVPVTANSSDQLRDVLFAEIAKWHRRLPAFLRDMLELNTERVFVRADPEGAFAVARTARPERPEALQGFHASTLAFFIEEASGIEDIIFETAGGALSSENSWVFLFGNPTRSQGYFFRSFHQSRAEWRTYHIPCSHSSRVSPDYPVQIANEYGLDSNVYRVRVLGEFPLSEDDAVIPLGLIEASVNRDVAPSETTGIVWGLDVARFGDDTTALAKRCGNVLIEPIREWRKLDNMQVAGLIAKEYRETPESRLPTSINIDVIGLGAGVVDRLRELRLPARGINVGESSPTDPKRFMRLRDELWWSAREWFEARDCRMPRDDGLISELVSPKYRIESSGKLKIESKDEMKKRGIKSPNRADAFCLTFAGGDVLGRDLADVAMTSYDPFKVGAEDYARSNRQANSGFDYTPF